MDALKAPLEDYDYVRLVLSDIYGINRAKILHTSHVNHAIEGCSLFIGTVAMGPKGSFFWPRDSTGNALLRGDPSSVRCVPWADTDKFRVCSMMGETAWGDGSAQKFCPRFIARQQLERLEERGFRLLSSFEAEMTILDGDSKPVFGGSDYLDLGYTSALMPFLMEVDSQMRKAGVEIEGLHTELGPGQVELIMQPSWGLDTADNMVLLRSGVKEIAKKFGLTVSNVSQAPDPAGCISAHFNFSIHDARGNDHGHIFSDVSSPDKLSDFARHFLAGLVEHGAALTALCCPTVNCYRRLHCFTVPDLINWAIDNRLSAFRVKNSTPSGTYFENRLPSAMSNPYIVLAATLAAGLDGVDRKLPFVQPMCPEAKALPYTLNEALAALENDAALKKAFGEEFMELFCGCKRNIDLVHLQDFQKDPDDNEERKRKELDFYLHSM